MILNNETVSSIYLNVYKICALMPYTYSGNFDVITMPMNTCQTLMSLEIIYLVYNEEWIQTQDSKLYAILLMEPTNFDATGRKF